MKIPRVTATVLPRSVKTEDVAKMLMDGVQQQDVAKDLGLTLGTVKTYAGQARAAGEDVPLFGKASYGGAMQRAMIEHLMTGLGNKAVLKKLLDAGFDTNMNSLKAYKSRLAKSHDFPALKPGPSRK